MNDYISRTELSVERGARIVRVHDVKETVAALQVWNRARPPMNEQVGHPIA